MGVHRRYEKTVLMMSAAFLVLMCAVCPPEPEGMSARTEEPAARSDETGPRSLLPGEKIDINAADCYDLGRLPGVGPETARKIVEYRQKHGSFRRTNALLKVKGMDKRTFAEIQEYICLNGGTR